MFIDLSTSLAYAAPFSMIIMFGGYISATQVATDSVGQTHAYVQAYLIYRPLLLYAALVVIAPFLVDMSSTFMLFVITFCTYLTLGSITDVLLFYAKERMFIFINMALSFFVTCVSLMGLISSKPVVLVYCLLAVAATFVVFLLFFQKQLR